MYIKLVTKYLKINRILITNTDISSDGIKSITVLDCFTIDYLPIMAAYPEIPIKL